jgi:pilus assembly protein Flp/PilA
MKRSLRNLWQDSQGQDLVEYALAAGMVAVAAVAAMPKLTTVFCNVFTSIAGVVQNQIP